MPFLLKSLNYLGLEIAKTFFPKELRSCYDNLNTYPLLIIMFKFAQLISGEIFKHGNVKIGSKLVQNEHE